MTNQSGKWILIATVCIGLSACTIHKTAGYGEGPQAFAVDAKQRFLVTKEGAGRDSVYKFCAEPSPDVFSTISAAIEASGSYNDKAKADMKLALSEAASSIGSRTETIQLLRDAMYRICELTMNGDMDKTEATQLHRQYQKSMVTLAAVAALADVARPPAVALTGNAQLSGGARIAELSQKVDEQKVEVKSKQAALDAADAALKKSVDAVCAVHVDESDGCTKDAATCNPNPAGKGVVCDAAADMKSAGAATDGKQVSRHDAFCAKQAEQEECKDLKARVDADADANEAKTNASDALAQLQKDLAAAKAKPDLAASTSAVSIPSDARPRNVEAVAGVVDHLVTEVYADEHIGECIDVISQHTNDQQTMDTQAFLTEASTMTDPSKIQATVERIRRLGNASKDVQILLAKPPSDVDGVHKLAKQVLSDTEPDAKSAKDRFDATRGLYDYCAAISSSLGRLVSAVESRKEGAPK